MAFASLNGVYVKDSDSRVFERLIDRSITEIEIPKGITRIGPGAFEGCSQISGTVTVPDGVTRIEYNAFSACKGITELILPDGLEYIGGSGLVDMSSLKRLVLPPKVTTFTSTMAARSGYTEFVAEGDIKSVGPAVFQNCYNCLSYDFTHCTSVPPLSNTNAFLGINTSAKILVPAYLYDEWIVATNWAAYADYIFAVGDGIYGSLEYALGADGASYTVTGIGSYGSVGEGTELVVPNEYDGLPVTSIAASAFEGNGEIVSVSIPESIVSIGKNAFNGCTNISYIYFGAAQMNDLNVSDYAFLNAGKDTDGIRVVIGNKVSAVPKRLFSGNAVTYECANIKSIEFEDGSVCTEIGDNAFYYCKINESFIAPATLESIGSYAFNSSEIDTVFDFSACLQIPSLASATMGSVMRQSILVPAALYDEWITATNWAAFANRIVAV